jgi:RNA polymerase subunit RPABC4/transcription elongation factor Spt4
MSLAQASCPACGGPITFKTSSSIVVVCDYCNSAIARGDKNLQDMGKVADLVDTGSPLDVGLSGVYQGVPFQLTGRAQLGHEAGGVWDEWYALFADGRWGWLAEAQGRFYMTFERPVDQRLIMPFEVLQLGQPVPALSGPVPLVVAEKGAATMLGAKGEIPYPLIPGRKYYFADLSGAHGEFATLDYSDVPPSFYVGREIPLEMLGFPVTARAPEREAKRITAKQLNCPQCGGPLAVRAPDVTERVACPNCGALLDVKCW